MKHAKTLTTFWFKCHVSSYATLQRAAIYFIFFLKYIYRVNLQGQVVKLSLLLPTMLVSSGVSSSSVFPSSQALRRREAWAIPEQSTPGLGRNSWAAKYSISSWVDSTDVLEWYLPNLTELGWNPGMADSEVYAFNPCLRVSI